MFSWFKVSRWSRESRLDPPGEFSITTVITPDQGWRIRGFEGA